MYRLPLIEIILSSLFGGLFCAMPTYGQTAKDSLVQQMKVDQSQAGIYFLIAGKSAKNDPDKAWEYLKKGKEHAGSDPYLNALAVFYEAQILKYTAPRIAERTFLQADKLLASFHSREALMIRARALSNYTELRRLKGDFKTVFSILTQKVIPLAKAAKDSIYLAEKYASVGQIMMEQGQYKKAAQYYNEGLDQLKGQRKNGPLQLSIKISACQNLIRSKQIIKAKSLLDELRDLIPPGTALAVRFALNEGIYYNKISRHQIALQKLLTAKALAIKLKNDNLLKLVTFYQMITLNLLKKYKEAQQIASTTFDKSPLIASNNLVIYQNNAANYFEQRKYDSAYYYLQKFNHIKDSLYEERLQSEIGALEVKFKTQENLKKIAELENAQLQVKFEGDRQRFYLGILGISTLFLAVLTLLLYKYIQKNKKEHVQREQVSITTALLKGQEAERRRVARDLHDDLGGTLTSLKMRFANLIHDGKLNIDSTPLDSILGQLDQSVLKIRRIANNMMPQMLLKLGLEAALKDLCSYYSSENLHITLHYIDLPETLPEPYKLGIYRIIQELLTNTVKHARAQNVVIQCSQMEYTIFVTYEDDGIGLGQSENSPHKGQGLENIRARVAYLNGQLEIVSGGTHKGTSFNIELNVSDELSNRNR